MENLDNTVNTDTEIWTSILSGDMEEAKIDELDLEIDENLEENSFDFGEINFNLIPTADQLHTDNNNENRFRAVTQSDVDNFMLTHENKNTKRKTQNDQALFEKYLTSVGEIRNMEIIPPSQLNEHLCKFFLYVQKKRWQIRTQQTPVNVVIIRQNSKEKKIMDIL